MMMIQDGKMKNHFQERKIKTGTSKYAQQREANQDTGQSATFH